MTDREALERIARLALEERDWDEDPRVEGVAIALEALGWVERRCGSRFTGCVAIVVGPEAELGSAGWVRRGGDRAHWRCPAHATTVDPTSWPGGTWPGDALA